ncbi:helix-turn-helix domain-containing protein [Streptomyces spirodelae]|uniref:Helix-turn-helix domain-containing protein n=1 Tax=Streptomyces spirodelae TaxID=2812904 RepID=A0ABS3X1E7_9ACTN|nr:helix-turn-helix transcriptional regulator [Streptomyces spirodelae]MBO8189203.1 helix-turn-helix domain-containing protein [Streptomyces spirodelae]
MARPMKELPETDTPAASFAKELRALYEQAGRPRIEDMAHRTGVSTSSLSQAHSGERAPTWHITRAYVTACRGNVQKWRARWEDMQAQVCARRLNFQPDFRHLALDRVPPKVVASEKELAAYLDLVRQARGLSLRDIARHSPYYSHHTYGAALRGDRPLTVHILRGVLSACQLADPTTLAQWLIKLAQVRPDQAIHANKLLTRIRPPRPRPRPDSGAPNMRMSLGGGPSPKK